MRRSVMAMVAAGVLLFGSTACGADIEAYCSAVEDVGKSNVLSELDYGKKQAVQTAEDKVAAVVEVAPEDVRPWWEAIQKGVRVSGKLVAGAWSDPEKVKSGMVTLQKMQKAIGKVDKDVDKRCKYDISAG